jgi:hypothetical protein
MQQKKIIHPVLGEIDPIEGPSVLDDETTVAPEKFPSAFASPLIETKPVVPSFRDQLRRGLIILAKKAIEKLEEKK